MEITLNALVFDGELKLDCAYPRPRPPRDEVLVRVRRAGICNTDLEITQGYMNFRGVLGHEFVGVVAEGEMCGTRVVGEINASDGTCPTCQRGDVTHCPNRTVLGIAGRDGAFADFLTLPARNLHPVPDAVSDRVAVFVEPLAAALEITERVHLKPTDRVLIIGDGKLGLLVAQVLNLTGADVTALGRHAHKLAILGARGIRTTRAEDELKGQFDVAVDCTGQASGFDLARKFTRPRGTLVLKSTFHGGQETAFAPLVVDEVTIVGSRCGPFEPALRLLERDLVDVDSMLTAEFSLTRGLEAFARAREKDAVKVQVVMRE